MKRIILSAACLLSVAGLGAKVRVAAVFADNMVLQRDLPVNIWGWADPNERVKVQVGKEIRQLKADAKGEWTVSLSPRGAGDAGVFEVSGKDSRVSFQNVVFGEVWYCSGQSNMGLVIRRTADWERVAAGAANPDIRVARVAQDVAFAPKEDCLLMWGWKAPSPDATPEFNAVAYFLAAELQKALKVPVGMLCAPYGASTAESWLSDARVMDLDGQMWRRINDYKNNTGFEDYLKDKSQLKQSRPTVCYNAMYYPVRRYTVRGAAWYQGESNSREPGLYFETMKRLIDTWRGDRNDPDLPVLVVQLANFRNKWKDGWVAIQNAQSELAAKIPNVYTSITNDCGDNGDIHPKDKQTVGYRLSLLARRHVYGEKELIAQGPTFKNMQIDGDKAVLTFDNVGRGLKCKAESGALTNFEIAGSDGVFYPADAKISAADSVVVRSRSVSAPKNVRYGWKADLTDVTFYNSAWLPAGCFSTLAN